MSRVLAAFVCRSLLWLFAVFAAGEVQLGKNGQPASEAARFVAASGPVPLVETAGYLWHCAIADPESAPDRGDFADSCDEPALGPPLLPPLRSRLTVVSAGSSDQAADRTPNGVASARAPPPSSLA